MKEVARKSATNDSFQTSTVAEAQNGGISTNVPTIAKNGDTISTTVAPTENSYVSSTTAKPTKNGAFSSSTSTPTKNGVVQSTPVTPTKNDSRPSTPENAHFQSTPVTPTHEVASATGTKNGVVHWSPQIKDVAKQKDVNANSIKVADKGLNQKQQQPLTLLQKAMMFRSLYPREWQKREEERTRREKMTLEKITMDPFLQRYMDKVIQERKRELEEAEKRKHEPRKLLVQISYVKHGKAVHPDFNLKSMAESVSNLSHFDLTEQKEQVCDKQCARRDLILTVNSGINLNNKLETDQALFEKVHLKVIMMPDHQKWNTKRKSEFRYLTPGGATKWNHTFVVRGVCPELLSKKYFVVSVFGVPEGSSDKVCLGIARISGKNVDIKTTTQVRRPGHHETHPLTAAMNNPGRSKSHALELEPSDCPYLHLGSVLKRGLLQEKEHTKSLLRKYSVRRKSKDSPRKTAKLI